MGIAKFFKVKKIPKRFSAFTSFVKRPAALVKMAAGNKKLNEAFRLLFNKKTLGVAAGVGAVTYGATQVAAYIRENSGCFVHDDAGGEVQTCKLLNLSCCQPEKSAGMSSCAAFDTAPPGACAGYVDDDDDDDGGGGGGSAGTSCCKFCDCEMHGCLPSQRMECRKATVGEALTYYSQEAGGFVSDTLGSFLGGVFESFPYLPHLLWGCVLAAVVVFLSAVFR